MFLLILRTACRPEGWEQQVSVQTLSDRMMEDTAGLVPEGPMWGCSVLAWKQATGRFSGSSSTEAIFDKVELRCGAWLHCKAETIWRQGLRARPLELNNMNRYCWGRKQKKISRNRGSWDKRSLRLCHRRHQKDCSEKVSGTVKDFCRKLAERSPGMAITQSLVTFISRNLANCWKWKANNSVW